VEWKPGDPVPERTDEDVRAAFAKRMRTARTDLGLSQADAAEAAGCSQPVLSKLEKQGVASEEVLIRLHAFYDMRISYPSAPIDPVRRAEWFKGYQPRKPEPVA